MPPEWADRILAHDEEPLWNSGWVPLEPQEHHQYPHPNQGYGKWQDLQILSPSQYQGWAFTLDATPSNYDTRSQVWAFSTISTTPQAHQQRVIVQLTAVWAKPREDHTKTSWSMSQNRTTRESQCCMFVATQEHLTHREMNHNFDEDKETQRWLPGNGRAVYMTRSSQNGNPPLPELFRKKVEQATQKADSQDEHTRNPLPQPEPDQEDYQSPNKVRRSEAQTPALPNQAPTRGPTPRRLHFTTALDKLNPDTAPASTALAMNPSQTTVAPAGSLRETGHGTGTTLPAEQTNRALDTHEQGEEESPVDDEPLNVEYF